jgi:hypothetical protein
MFKTVPPTPTPSEADLAELFRRWYRYIAPRTRLPETIHVTFYPYVGINNTIRLKDGVLRVKLSDLLADAPASVLEAVAGILLGKLLRKPIPPKCEDVFRDYARSLPVRKAAEHVRRERGYKVVSGEQGEWYDLSPLFDRLNEAYFNGSLTRPMLTWSRARTRRILGHYDATHHAIVISRTLDARTVPPFVVEYVLYHEMLHVKHGVEHVGGRRCVHTPAFQSDERDFVDYEPAIHWLKNFADLGPRPRAVKRRKKS